MHQISTSAAAHWQYGPVQQICSCLPQGLWTKMQIYKNANFLVWSQFSAVLPYCLFLRSHAYTFITQKCSEKFNVICRLWAPTCINPSNVPVGYLHVYTQIPMDILNFSLRCTVYYNILRYYSILHFSCTCGTWEPPYRGNSNICMCMCIHVNYSNSMAITKQWNT